MEFIFQLMIILLATKIFGHISVKLGQPAVLGKLISGIIIGPAVLGWVHSSDVISYLSQIGVLLLMFIAGLETELGELNKSRNSSIAVGVGGLVFPLVIICGVGLLFGMGQNQAIFLGLVLAATSVSISVQTLRELGRLKSKESTTILGAALIDDIIVMIMLAVMMGFISDSSVNVGMVIGKKALFFIVIALLGWKLVPWLIDRFASFRVTEVIISAGFIICLLFAYIAENLGVAGIIGAFFAGVAISRTKYKKEVEQKVEPIAYAAFVPIFFVSIGLSVSFKGVGNHIWFIVAFSIVAIITKWVGAGLGAKLTGFNMKSSLGIGAGMISRGEVALILALIGLESKLLDQKYFTPLIIIIIISTLVTPPILKILFNSNKQQNDNEQIENEQTDVLLTK